ncbi:DUF6471 domain-containing protein [Devosia sp. Root436]|uniref:DUF6471 domain-containing protein n=1 Tax=Devosia sp. Root436 TaxID=1736537 RepID=UPI0032976979
MWACFSPRHSRASGNLHWPDHPETVIPGLMYQTHQRAAIGVGEKEANVRNKLSRGKFAAALLLQCLAAIGQVNCT